MSLGRAVRYSQAEKRRENTLGVRVSIAARDLRDGLVQAVSIV